MATTYVSADLKTSPKDRARFQLGDTGTMKDAEGVKTWLLQDEEVEAFIDLWGYSEGVAQCADALATRFAQEPEQYEDEAGVKVVWSSRIKTWQNLANQLRSGIAKTTANMGSPILSGRLSGPDMTGVRP
jgi:hypothetical protein